MHQRSQIIKQSSINILNDQLFCPISHQIMKQPVVIQSGHTFDKKSIQMWFNRGSRINPITGQKLQTLKLYPNICVRNIIQKLPDFQQRMKKQTKNYQDLLQTVIALQKLWNSETPNGLPELRKQKQKLQAQNQQLKNTIIIQKIELQRKLMQKQAKILRLEHHLRYQTNSCNQLKRELSITKRQINQKRQRQQRQRLSVSERLDYNHNMEEKIQKQNKGLDETQIIYLKNMKQKQRDRSAKKIFTQQDSINQFIQIDSRKNVSQVLNRPPKYPTIHRDHISPSKSEQINSKAIKNLSKQKEEKDQIVKKNPQEKQQKDQIKQKQILRPVERMKQRKQMKIKKDIDQLHKAIKINNKSNQKPKKR